MASTAIKNYFDRHSIRFSWNSMKQEIGNENNLSKQTKQNFHFRILLYAL